MYLRGNLIKFLKVKNIIFYIAALFGISSSAYVLVSLYLQYGWEELMKCKATPESILYIKIGIILIVIAELSRRMIGDVKFYSNYFELDLDGYITYAELAKALGKTAFTVKIQLHLYKIFYMKQFKFVNEKDKQIVLDSKIVKCLCKNCGAEIEKRMYFTGKCEYCESSDVFASVISDNRFYSISSDQSKKKSTEAYYLKKNILNSILLQTISLTIVVLLIIVVVCCGIDSLNKYFDDDYIREEVYRRILSGETTRISIKAYTEELRDSVVYACASLIAFIPWIFAAAMGLKYIKISKKFANSFSKQRHPYIEYAKLPIKKNPIRKMRVAIRKGYLKNCTFEVRTNNYVVALAKKVVKDTCPFCGASITGAVDENYKCRYCDNLIMGVVVKS